MGNNIEDFFYLIQKVKPWELALTTVFMLNRELSHAKDSGDCFIKGRNPRTVTESRVKCDFKFKIWW